MFLTLKKPILDKKEKIFLDVDFKKLDNLLIAIDSQ